MDLFSHLLSVLLDALHLLLVGVNLLSDHALLLIDVFVLFVKVFERRLVDLIDQGVPLAHVPGTKVILLFLVSDALDAQSLAQLAIVIVVRKVRVSLAVTEHTSDQILIERLDYLLLLVLAILAIALGVALVFTLAAKLCDSHTVSVSLDWHKLMVAKSFHILRMELVKMPCAKVHLVLHAVLCG